MALIYFLIIWLPFSHPFLSTAMSLPSCSDSLQFGYKAKTSTTQCSWLVTEVCDYYLKRGTPVICVTLDCSKAFDKCKFDKLFDNLMNKNVPAIVIRALVYIYEEQKKEAS